MALPPHQKSFLEDESPPASPTHGSSQSVRILEPKKRQNSNRSQMEHRRWNSDSTSAKGSIKPFSYEYRFEDGRLTGLVELHPENYMHYSRRNPARAVSRAESSRPSQEDVHTTPSVADQHADKQAAQRKNKRSLSPAKTSVLARALSLHSLRPRAQSADAKRAPSSPYARPEIEALAATFGRHGPQEITSPLPSPAVPQPKDMYESPRMAPSPPQRSSQQWSPQAVTFGGTDRSPSLTQHRRFDSKISMPSGPSSPRLDQENLAVEGLGIALTVPTRVEQRVIPSSAKQPLLRRKTSKRFLEHMERRDKGPRPTEAQPEDIPPVPPLVLPVEELRRPLDILDAFPKPRGSPRPSHLTSNMRMPQYATQRESSGQLNLQPVTLKRSLSTTRAHLAVQSNAPKRSMSTRSRPAPVMADVCFAQVRPVLQSPVVAKGHARMISC